MCLDCARGQDHCHGTLLRWADGWVECTEPGCLPDRARHGWVGDAATEF